jgi:hypothetical protein
MYKFWGRSSEEKKKGMTSMTNKLYPTDILEQSQDILTAWDQIDETLNFGDLNKAALAAELAQAAPLLSQIGGLETQLTDLRNRRDALYQSLWDKVKRVRNGVKAHYGDDSSQYEMVGGTRLSERKSPKRKASAAA